MNVIIKIILNILLIPVWIVLFVLMSLAITGIALLGSIGRKAKARGQYFAQRSIFDPDCK